jgi:hypothetical protein
MRLASASRAALLLALVAGCAPAPAPAPGRVPEARTMTDAPAAPGAGAPTRDPEWRIALPDLRAIELPAGPATTIGPDASPLRDLLASATLPGHAVTHDVTAPLPIGPSRVSWTAWRGAPGAGAMETGRQAWVYVLPPGHAPVGISGKHNATSANHAPHVVRDATGGLHVVWLDGGRPREAPRVLYRRGRTDARTGAVTWETEAQAMNEPGVEAAAGFAALAASEGAIHIAWQAAGTVRYRRLVRDGSGWRPEPVRNTGARGAALDSGPALAVRGDDEIHVASTGGYYALSRSGGSRWSMEPVPKPGPGETKNPALAVDRAGHAHVVFVYKVRNARGGDAPSRPSGGYWQLRYVRRPAGGGWADAHDVLGHAPEWADAGMERDILSDWPDLAVDDAGHLHVAWHGTARTHIYGRDEAYYVRRPATGPGAWGPWEPPQTLHRVDAARRESYSYAPSLAIGEDGVVVATVFFAPAGLPEEVFDADLVVLRDGRPTGQRLDLVPTARAARAESRPADAVGTWFPSIARCLHRDGQGRTWLDVLYTAVPPRAHASTRYVVYRYRDITDLVRAGAPPPPPR